MAEATMHIVISSGHGKLVRGAEGPPPWGLDEVDEARKVVDRVAEILRASGVGVDVFHDDVSTTQSENLDRIVEHHNACERDLDVSVHFNAYQATTKPMGTEVLHVTQSALAADVSTAIASAGGFIDRGAKKRTDLAFLNNTDAPAILIETCFVDSEADVELYRSRFNEICQAIAASVAWDEIVTVPPDVMVPPDVPRPPQRPEDVPLEDRPTLQRGDDGPDVEDLQSMLPDFDGAIDGEFGPVTDDAVRVYQSSRGLAVDGIVGEETWQALYDQKPPLPLPPDALSKHDQDVITNIARSSKIARYAWQDRGVAPSGYTQGMALAFAQTLRKLMADHAAAVEMAKARTDDDLDVLNVYRDVFADLDMSNEEDGVDTLRHLYVLMLGSGMRESNGRHCEGRDLSAENVQSDTAEAGLFQTSYNAHTCHATFDQLFDEYRDPANQAACYYETFSENVSCAEDEWESYGSGNGYEFQKLCKNCPAFAVETHGVTLRNRCNHYGPIIRGEVEVCADADTMFRAVQEYIEHGTVIA